MVRSLLLLSSACLLLAWLLAIVLDLLVDVCLGGGVRNTTGEGRTDTE